MSATYIRSKNRSLAGMVNVDGPGINGKWKTIVEALSHCLLT